MTTPPATAPPRLAMNGISKSFGGVKALRGVTLEARSGEVLAICGENGAGKSTLMKVLAGALTDYEGEILLDGVPVRFQGPRDAEDAGIRIIHQELNLVPELSVAANLFLGREIAGPLGFLNTRAMEAAAANCSTASGRRSRRGAAWPTSGSATSRWSRSPRRWPPRPRS